MTQVRTGQAPPPLERDAFGERFRADFRDPAFEAEAPALARLEAIAWQAYQEGRKAPRTHPAGEGYEDPGYALSDDWRETAERLKAAQARWQQGATPSRVLLVCGASRNDGSCPGEMSKSFRLAQRVRGALTSEGLEVDLLDLSELISGYGRHIHPCKGCVSTAMPLCHWPCSCYPNHAMRQTGDWMAEICERWVSAHGVVVVTPVYWYQSPSPLKLMMDRLVCADGGNPDPTRTQGKDAAKAKAIELAGWDYPQHLAGRVYGVMVHGDVAGIEATRRGLSDWLDWMGLIDAGPQARLDRYIGYYQAYADSHDTLDADEAVQQEAHNLGLAVAHAVRELRAGRLQHARAALRRPRPK